MRSSSFGMVLLCFALIFSCSGKQQKMIKDQKAVTILIQPFNDLRPENVTGIANRIKKMYPYVRILKPIGFPANTYYQPRNRYRADSVISFLSRNNGNGFVTMSLTSKDISAAKGPVKDFGIMGLALRPGNACVASSFRLDKYNAGEQFFKIAVHELGHTQGLPHCPVKTCFMRAAEGKNPTNEETDFCKKCKQFLISKNWKFNSI